MKDKTISGPNSGTNINFDMKYFQLFIDKINFMLTGCWEWNAATDKDGYGVFSYHQSNRSNKRFRSHRLAFYLRNKVAIKNKLIIHSCHNPSCVNPDHLSIGTNSENIKAAHKEGNLSSVGSKNACSKLTEKQVLEIRNLKENHNWTQQEIADTFNIDRANVSYILSRKTWTHI